MTKSVFKKHLERLASELKGVHSVFLISNEGIIIEDIGKDKSESRDEIAAYIVEITKTTNDFLKKKMEGELKEAFFITDNLKTCIHLVNSNIIMLNISQDGEFSKGRHLLKKYAKLIEKEL